MKSDETSDHRESVRSAPFFYFNSQTKSLMPCTKGLTRTGCRRAYLHNVLIDILLQLARRGDERQVRRRHLPSPNSSNWRRNFEYFLILCQNAHSMGGRAAAFRAGACAACITGARVEGVKTRGRSTDAHETGLELKVEKRHY